VKQVDRRQFIKGLGASAAAASLHSNIAKALTIGANNRTGTLQDVEHIVVLMQENRPFDHHFGTMRGVRGFSDPRAVQIDLPRLSGGAVRGSVFLQPVDPSSWMAQYALPADAPALGGPSGVWPVVPPFRVDPNAVSPGLTTLGGTWLPGTDHGWGSGHASWNLGQYDQFAATVGPMAMSYMTRADLPYHFALADAFTVGDAYHCSIMGPTNPNRTYMWSGCVGNLHDLGAGGTDGQGAGPMTSNGLSPNNA
jgi:phospholipase C